MVMTQKTVILTVNQPTMAVSLQKLLCLILLQAPDLEEEWDQRHKKNIFFSLNQCMFLTKQFFLNRILHRVNYLTFIYKRWERGRISFDVTLEVSIKFSCCPSKRGFKDIESGTIKNAGPPCKG